MAQCRCRTINLALTSVEKLKEMERKMQRIPGRRYDVNVCQPHESIPAPPGPVSKRKIMVCMVRPVQFQAPPVPCVCPPCPPCRTYGERSVDLLKTGLKLFVLYAAAKWTIDNNIWGDHKGTTDFMLGVIQSNFPSGGNPHLPDLRMLKYQVLHGWDTVVGNFFYYTFGLPLKMFAQVRDSIMIRDEAPPEYYCPPSSD